MSNILLPLAVLACPISMVVMMVMMGRSHNDKDKPHDELNIIRQRYAKGEITKEQFEQLKKDLK